MEDVGENFHRQPVYGSEGVSLAMGVRNVAPETIDEKLKAELHCFRLVFKYLGLGKLSDSGVKY